VTSVRQLNKEAMHHRNNHQRFAKNFGLILFSLNKAGFIEVNPVGFPFKAISSQAQFLKA